MSSPLPWTRRGFLSALGAAGVVATSPQLCTAGCTEILDAVAGRPGADRRSLVLVARSKTEGSGSGSIEIYDAEGSLWKTVGTPIATESPRGLTLHPNLPVLYVAHREAIHRNLPRGSVSAFVLDPRLKTLVQISREPLALSAPIQNTFRLPLMLARCWSPLLEVAPITLSRLRGMEPSCPGPTLSSKLDPVRIDCRRPRVRTNRSCTRAAPWLTRAISGPIASTK